MNTRPRGGVGSFFIVDANNFLFRAYHGLPMLTGPDGTPVNAVHGYMQMIGAVRKDFAPEYFLAVFDAPGKGWREEIFPAYKANRPPAPEDLRPQIPLVRRATEALGLPWIEMVGYEADDLIAAYAIAGQAAGLEVVVVSSDKDLMQLVDPGESGPGGAKPIRLFDTMKGRVVGPERVMEKFGVGPEKLGDLLALAGDSVDNVPGIQGIGPKTAATLLDEWGDLEGILANASEVKQKKRRERLIEFADDARMSRKLVELRTDFELPREVDSMRDRGADRDALEGFCRPLGLKVALTGAVSGGAVARGPARARSEMAVSVGAATLEPLRGAVVPTDRARPIRVGELETLRERVVALEAAGGLSFEVRLSESDPMRASIVGVAIGDLAGELEPYYVPIEHRSLTDPPGSQATWEAVRDVVGPALANAALPKRAHAHKAQCVALSRHGLEVEGVTVDPMLASYTLDPARTSHDLPSLAKDLLGHTLTSDESVMGKGRKRVGFDQIAVDEAARWVGERVEATRLLGGHLDAEVSRAGPELERLFRDVEMPLARVLRHLELRGIMLDADVLGAQAIELGTRLEELRNEIEDRAGHPVNPESPLQLQKLLFEERGLPAKKKTKTGYSTDAGVLEELSLLDPIVKPILEHRSLSKLKGTYLDTLPTLVDPNTGRLHTHFRQAVAQTGRLSSSDPNLQNIPIRTEAGRKIRQGFVAPEGMSLVAMDYSQIELRVLAHMSGDPNLCKAFRDGADVHRRTAAEVFDTPEEVVSADQRRIAKAVNFGVIYGQTPFGLSRQLGIPQGRAGKYIKSYFTKIPGVKAYMEHLIEEARRTGHASTIMGRRRRIPELARRGAARGYGERIARNTPIQGSAADILKVAMVEVERVLADRAWARMLLTVHDELIFECDEARVDELVAAVKPVMEGAAKLDVPLVVDAGSGPNWGSTKG